MNIGTMQFLSRSLGRHVTYTVLLPDGQDTGVGPYPVLFQLHGRSDDHSVWLNQSNLIHHVRGYPLIVVLPDGAISMWSNASPRERYEDFIMNDLSEHLKRTFHVTTEKWAIGGLSMGGLGAIRLGLKYPDRFCSIWAHSSVIPTQEEARERWNWPNPVDLDCYKLIEEIDGSIMPRLSFDCGVDDFLIEHNRRFHRFLQERGTPHTYQEHPGAHTWAYWDLHVQEALVQHARELGIERIVPEPE